MSDDRETRNGARELFVAWRAPDPIARWYTVGRLTAREGRYTFCYTRGFDQAASEAGMRPIHGFPEPTERYETNRLPPLFKNRLMRPSRPDYGDFITSLGLPAAPDPLDVLSRSEGYRATDYYRVYLRPSPVASSLGPRFKPVCFCAGLRFREASAIRRAAELVPNEELVIVAEPTNRNDADAHRLETADGHHIGYVPRYHAHDLTQLERLGVTIKASVRRNNSQCGPLHRAILFQLDAPWPDGFMPFDTVEHLPVGRDPAAREAWAG